MTKMNKIMCCKWTKL